MNRLLQILAVLLIVGGGTWWLTRTEAPDIAFADIVAHPVPGAPNAVMVTMEIANNGGPDTLTDARAAGARLTTLKSLKGYGLPVPGGSSAFLSMEAGHVSVIGLAEPAAPGALLPLKLEFARTGAVSVKARVAEPMPMAHGGLLDLPAEGAPGVTVYATRDATGWIVSLSLENLRLAPELVDQPHKPATGHAHLYVDGMKLGRVFEKSARIGALAPGTYSVEVTLASNDHRTLAIDGQTISATTEIVVD